MSGRLLWALLLVEVLLGWLWIGPLLLVRDPGLGVLYLLFLGAPIQLACMLVAVWRFAKHPAERPLAAVVFATPIALLIVPGLLRSPSEPPLFALSGGSLTFALAAPPFLVPLALCLFAPRWVAPYLPRFLVCSRAFHVGLVALLALGSLAWLGLVGVYASAAERDVSGVLLGAFIAYSGAGLLVWAAIALYSWVALFNDYDSRNHRLRVVVLVLCLPAFPVFWGGFLLLRLASGPG